MKKGKLCFCWMPEVLKLLRKLKVIAFLLLLTIFTVQAAEQKSITGTVKDNSGQPLPGVTVLIKGTTQGTVTNIDGIFTISNLVLFMYIHNTRNLNPKF